MVLAPLPEHEEKRMVIYIQLYMLATWDSNQMNSALLFVSHILWVPHALPC